MPNSASSDAPPVLSAEEKKFELLLKGKARCDAGFEKWMKDLKAEDEERFDGAAAAAKRAGNAMVIMWAFCIRKRDKIIKNYPDGSPELPAPTRCLIRSFLDLEKVARGNLVFQDTRGVFGAYAGAIPYTVHLSASAVMAAREDRKRILEYYLNLIAKEAAKGHTSFELTEQDLDAAPKLSTGEALGFEYVKKELQEKQLIVTGESPPYKVVCVEITGQDLLDFAKTQRGRGGIKLVDDFASMFGHDVQGVAGKCRARTLAARAEDGEIIADHFAGFCLKDAENGFEAFRVSKGEYKKAPKMRTGDHINMAHFKLAMEKRGFKVHDEDLDLETAADDDIVCRISW